MSKLLEDEKVAKLVAELSGRPKNELYQRALELK